MEVTEQVERISAAVTDNMLKDKVCGIVSVPWRNKDEWLDVYKKVYSTKLSDQNEAFNIMQKWQKRKLGCPFGVFCTSIILQGVIKDPVFHSDIEHSLVDDELLIIYGGSIIRFLNFLGSKDMERDKKGLESLYAKAQKIGLPDWIVNVRHAVSHGSTLPEIGLLRMCVTHILKFLKTCYWEVEERKLHDVVLLRPRCDTQRESFLKLLSVYLLVKEAQKQGHKSCKSLTDPLIRDEIYKLASYRLLSEQMENAPWEVALLETRLKKPLTENELRTYTLSNICMISLRYLMEYKTLSDINIWNIILSNILEDSIKHKCIRLDLWGSLIKFLCDRGNVCKILDPLLDNVFKEEMDSSISFWSKKLLILILQALLKRSKVEKLKLALCERIRKGRWESRVISTLSTTEKKYFIELIERTRSDLSKKLKKEIYIGLSQVAEKNDRRLRFKLRFTCDPLDSETIKEYMYRVCREPNDFTFIAFEFFADMLENSSRKIRKSIKRLINIYQGKEFVGNISDDDSSDVIYTLPMALAKLGVPEEECLEIEKEFILEETSSEMTKNEERLQVDTSHRLVVDAVFKSHSSIYKFSWPTFPQLP